MESMNEIDVNNFNSSELKKLSSYIKLEDFPLEKLDEPLALRIPDEKYLNASDGQESKQSFDVGDRNFSKIICRNESLAGDVHPMTGVPFERKTIELNDQIVEVVVPQFDYAFETVLPEKLHESSDKEQFDYCNKKLKESIEISPELSSKFTPEQIEQIKNGDRPDGYIWHHAENPGEMQLVDKDTHDKTGHTGGKAIWGGGSENR